MGFAPSRKRERGIKNYKRQSGHGRRGYERRECVGVELFAVIHRIVSFSRTRTKLSFSFKIIVDIAEIAVPLYLLGAEVNYLYADLLFYPLSCRSW